MMPLGTQRINEQGHLEIGGCDAVDLAEEFGTPLYVLDEAHLRENCRRYRDALAGACARGQVIYASKALVCLAVARIADQEGLFVDVASGGELVTALQAGVDPKRIVFHGNYKLDDERRLAHEVGVGRVVIDSLDELDAWADAARADGRAVPVQIRVNPDVKPDTHTAVQVGQLDSKFGLGISTGAALEAIRRAHTDREFELLGLHCHIGSQILDHGAFAAAARGMAGLADQAARLGARIDEINLGGGLGIRYLPEHQPPAIERFVAETAAELLGCLKQFGLPEPRILMEPGRSLPGEAGTTLYRLGVIKEIPGVRTYVSVDGGLSDNPRPEMYGAKYHCFVANRAGGEPDRLVTVAGRHCESDTLFRDVTLASPKPGDILAVQSTGAYGYSMAGNYNRFPKPAMVLVQDGTAEIIVRRETWEDLLRCDRLPERLMPG